jgi:hypothetical protein
LEGSAYVVLSEEEVQKDAERRAAILASLEWQHIVDDLSEVEVEQGALGHASSASRLHGQMVS